MSAGKRRGRSWRVPLGVGKEHTEDKHLLYDIQHGKCLICRHHVPRAEATVDHVIPKSKGGTDEFKNKVMLCYTCNQDKADKLLQEMKCVSSI